MFFLANSSETSSSLETAASSNPLKELTPSFVSEPKQQADSPLDTNQVECMQRMSHCFEERSIHFLVDSYSYEPPGITMNDDYEQQSDELDRFAPSCMF